ncbi:MAG TPA: NTP transferase domain-containing protein [Phycisphaerales bacterium]|nr:NTP transferase domain-containing protein [Phycisphaerales bacterium]
MDYVIVLAAGRGVRAGGPKALHVVNGRPWWEIQRERLERVGLPMVWVVSERVRTGMGEKAPERVVIADEMAPMFASVLAGVREVAQRGGANGVFVLPVDVPTPGAQVFRRLSACPSAAVPVHGGVHGHPVYISWNVVSQHVLPARPDDRLDRLIESERAEVAVDHPAVAVNLNTPDDFRRWEREEGA